MVGSYATGLTMKVERLPSSGGTLLGSGHKPARAQLFHTYGDTSSEHDMDFDWADGTIHAGCGTHWLKELLTIHGEDPAVCDRIREQCGKLVSDDVGTAAAQEIADIKKTAGALLTKAGRNRG